MVWHRGIGNSGFPVGMARDCLPSRLFFSHQFAGLRVFRHVISGCTQLLLAGCFAATAAVCVGWWLARLRWHGSCRICARYLPTLVMARRTPLSADAYFWPSVPDHHIHHWPARVSCASVSTKPSCRPCSVVFRRCASRVSPWCTSRRRTCCRGGSRCCDIDTRKRAGSFGGCRIMKHPGHHGLNRLRLTPKFKAG